MVPLRYLLGKETDVVSLVDQEYLELDPELIDPHPLNPNVGDREALESSIGEVGFYGAVIVRYKPDTGRYELIAGEHRWRTLRAAGHAVPAIMVEMTDEQALKALLADNEVTRRGRYNNDRLLIALRALPSVSGTGFDLEELEAHEAARVKAEERKKINEEKAVEFPRQYGIMIPCADEAEQEKAFNRLIEAGFDPAGLRALSI